MSDFSHHEACPNCGSKDNVGVWKDGHKFCFGCRWTDLPDKLVKLKPKVEKTPGLVSLPPDCNKNIPLEVRTWYLLLGLKLTDLDEHNFQWSNERGLCIYPVMNGDQLVAWNGRYFGTDKTKPKYFNQGPIHEWNPIIGVNDIKKGVVIVEDIVSAIRVSKCGTDAIPLFGSTLSDGTAQVVGNVFDHVFIWLDPDKRRQSLEMRSRFSQFMSSSIIMTGGDPKDCTPKEIEDQLYYANKNARSA